MSSRSWSRRLPAFVAAAAALLPLPPLAAQESTTPRDAGDSRPSTDPRDAKDPRDVQDPRDGRDPRAAPDPLDALEGKDLFDALYAADDVTRLKLAMHDDSWQILAYIDSHCEGWLSQVEHGAGDSEGGRKAMAEMQAKGRRLATLADDAIGSTRFSNYVNTFYGWSVEQQQSFRMGQALYHDGEKQASTAAGPEEAKQALTPLRQSLDRARELGDTWGQSMTLALIGQLQAANGDEAEARATMAEAERVGREIRDRSSVWTALSVTYESAVRTGDYEPARDALQRQYLLALEVNDGDVAATVMQKLVELNQRFDQPPPQQPEH